MSKQNRKGTAMTIASVDGSMMSLRPNSAINAMRYKSATQNSSFAQQGTVAKPDVIRWRIGKLDERYECKHCETYLKYPVQFIECCHRVCSTCLTDILRQSSTCPTCDKPIQRENIQIDHEFQKEINNIPVFCKNRQAGCNWEGSFKEHFNHSEDCEYAEGDLLCEFCKKLIEKKNEESHYAACPKFLIPCPANCGLSEIPREMLKDHLENTCNKNEIDCPFLDCGCIFKSKRGDMPKHLREAPGIHLNLMCKQLSLQRSQIQILTEIVDKQKDQLAELTDKTDIIHRANSSQLVWKIEKYTEKYTESKTGKKSIIFSPPFLSHRYGYKLALSTSLYGDGKAKGKFMSLFVCICKGEYDNLQFWPFNLKIKLTMLDQSEEIKSRNHVTYTIKPNTCKENLAFLGKPTNDRNASFGSQRFVELSALSENDYVLNDSMFIKVEIENQEAVAF